MSNSKYLFLATVLGDQNAASLLKAAERVPAIESVLFPRAILSWLLSSPRDAFTGNVPGIEMSELVFAKSEDGLSGSLRIADETFQFEKASVLHVAALTALALGLEKSEHPLELDIQQIANLGRTIDSLIKSRAAVKHCETPAVVTTKPKQNRPRLNTRLPSLKISKSEGERECSYCGRLQINDDRFTGCLCFGALRNGVTMRVEKNGYVLNFASDDWDLHAIQTLLTAFKGSEDVE